MTLNAYCMVDSFIGLYNLLVNKINFQPLVAYK